MDANDAIRTAVGRSGMSLKEASRRLGRADNFLSATFNNGGSPKACTVSRVALVTGHRLALVPEGELPPEAIVIDR